MADPITLYFDLPSAHTYLGIAELQRVAAKHGRGIDWVPISLMAVWKIHDYMPIGNPIAKGRYIKKDFTRTAGLLGLPLNIPKSFPRGDLSQARHLIWRIRLQDPELANRLSAALMQGYWAEGCGSDGTAHTEKGCILGRGLGGRCRRRGGRRGSGRSLRRRQPGGRRSRDFRHAPHGRRRRTLLGPRPHPLSGYVAGRQILERRHDRT